MSDFQRALDLTHAGLAERLGISRRTIQRHLASGGLGFDATHFRDAAKQVFDVDPALARRLAGHVGTTVEALGFVAPPAPAPAPVTAVAAPPPARPPARPEHADAMVCQVIRFRRAVVGCRRVVIQGGRWATAAADHNGLASFHDL